MTTSQLRVSAGIPTGGQFAATAHAEPTLTLSTAASETSDPEVLRNLNRSLVAIPEITDEQKTRLRARKTPLLDAFKAKGIAIFTAKAKVEPRGEESAA